MPEHIAKEDAEIIRLLRAAGTIPILVSNTPELCMNWETFNPRVGTTNNPYDTRRTAAGSSGGEVRCLEGSGENGKFFNLAEMASEYIYRSAS